MKRVKIIGAGSIGTHHAHASRQLGWDVTVTARTAAALDRMRSGLFPQRYGRWDPSIALILNGDAPRGGFDLIVIGTPPESHVALALAALDEQPAALLIEKPLAAPGDADLERLMTRAADGPTRVFVGYDHVIGQSVETLDRELESGTVGRVLTIDVEFCEHWDEVFKAHPWLQGPAESYLGFWRRGGGALSEQSHALNLWQHFARWSGAGRVVEIDARLDYVVDEHVEYDRSCLLTLRTESGLVGRVVQDVVTRPVRRRVRIKGEDGTLEWHLGYAPGTEAVIVKKDGSPADVRQIRKTRPDDFIMELRHIERRSADGASSPIDLIHGLETMRLIEAAHRSHRHGRTIPLLSPPAADSTPSIAR